MDRVPGGGILFFTRFSKNESTTMVVNKGVGVQIFGYSLKSRYYSVVNLGVGALYFLSLSLLKYYSSSKFKQIF